jgi:tetratricopeptide (TPR) repeat protein
MANWAIIVGVNHYSGPYPCLKGAVRDALKMGAWLRGHAAVPAANQLVVLGRCPDDPGQPSGVPGHVTRGVLVPVIRRLMQKSGGEGERLYFYFSGHGLTSRVTFSDENAIVLGDFTQGDTEASSIGLRSIFEHFETTRFRDQFFFIDACRNIPWEGEFYIGHLQSRTRDPEKPPVQQFICYATSPGVRAREIGEAGAETGAFTEVLLDGLNGKGPAKQWDADTEHYIVRWDDLFRYVEQTMIAKKVSVGEAAQRLFQVPRQSGERGGGEDINPVLAQFPDGFFGHEALQIRVDPTAAAGGARIEAWDRGDVRKERQVGTVPLTMWLPPRPYQVRATAPAYRPEKPRWPVRLYAPEELTVRFLPEADGPPGPTSPGGISPAAPPFGTPVRDNLIPRDYARLVGREHELARIMGALDPASHTPLVTLTGDPGVGCTALAREVAHRLVSISKADPAGRRAFQGVIWASRRQFTLNPREDAAARPYPDLSLDDVFVTVASTLKQPELLQARPEERLAVLRDVLSERRCLLILDHFDGLRGQDQTAFASLLTGTARRGPTRAILTGHRIGGLSGLDDVVEAIELKGLAEWDALRLLTQEGAGVAQLERASNDDLLGLVEEAHGLPLILRWAVGLLHDSGQPLEWVIGLLRAAGGRPAEFCLTTMAGRLTPPQRRLLQAAALFPQPTSVEAAASAARLSRPDRAGALGRLLTMRLAQLDDAQRIHLPLRVRRHALADLAPDASLRRTMTSAAISYVLRRVRAARRRADQPGREYLGGELGNILWAARQAMERRHYRTVLAFRDNLHEYMFEQRYFNEGLTLGEWAHDSAERLGDTEQQAWCALYPLGRLHFHQGSFEKAERWCTAGLRMFERVGNQHGIASAQRYLGRIMQARGQLDEAERLFTGGLQTAARISPEPANLKGFLIASAAGLAQAREDYPAAKQGFEQALFQFREANNWEGIAATLRSLGEIALATGRYDEAERRFKEGLAVAENHDWPAGRAKILLGQASLAEAKGQLRHAQGLLGLAYDSFYNLSDFPGLVRTDARLARVTAAIAATSTQGAR